MLGLETQSYMKQILKSFLRFGKPSRHKLNYFVILVRASFVKHE